MAHAGETKVPPLPTVTVQPGLGVRILGALNKQFADWLREAHAIFIDELRNTIDPETNKSGYDLTSQAFAVFCR